MIKSINLRVDLSDDYINKDIIFHEGDVNGTELVLAVYDNNSEFDLTGCTAEYDATIDGRLAEEAAMATTTGTNKIKVPVTANMTAISGLLVIDVRILRNGDILGFQTISAKVQRSVINDKTIVDPTLLTDYKRIQEVNTLSHIENIYKYDVFYLYNGGLFKLTGKVGENGRRFNYFGRLIGSGVYKGTEDKPNIERLNRNVVCPYHAGDFYIKKNHVVDNIEKIYRCTRTDYSLYLDYIEWGVDWEELPLEIYSKDDIDSMIGDIGTALDALNGHLAEV